MLTVTAFSTGYSARKQVLHGLSLTVQAGDFVGLLGPNGSGKSTLLHAMAGFLSACSGSICFKNKPLQHYSAKERARNIALVPQKLTAIPHFTVFDIVSMGRYPYLNPWQGLSAQDKACVAKAMQATSCLDFAQQYITELSGGEAQRAFVAQALAQEAELLLLDEVSANLDMARVVELFCLLRSFTKVTAIEQQTGQKAIVAAMHDLNLAGAFCNQLICLKNGKILAQGTTEQVFTAALLSELYETSITVFKHPQSGVPQALLQIPL